MSIKVKAKLQILQKFEFYSVLEILLLLNLGHRRTNYSLAELNSSKAYLFAKMENLQF